jgi:hypothetical protein
MAGQIGAYPIFCQPAPYSYAFCNPRSKLRVYRTTAAKIIQRQFGELMDRSGLKVDKSTGKTHTLYSLRHTAICMRIINSEGQVNIFNLAKNAGTSVDQIEHFYARFLPLSKEMARNLQSFG